MNLPPPRARQGQELRGVSDLYKVTGRGRTVLLLLLLPLPPCLHDDAAQPPGSLARKRSPINAIKSIATRGKMEKQTQRLRETK